MTEPTSGHCAVYREGLDDGRLLSPSYERNCPPIIEALTPRLDGRTGTALEIGSGTGQHVCAFAEAFPALDWLPSDPDARHRESIRLWRDHLGVRLAEPLALDAAEDWAALPGIAAHCPLALVYSMNVIHIAPFAVAEGIVAGAGKALAPGGLLIFYGPFREGGEHTGEGNRIFDERLRADNPDWGVRDVEEISALGHRAGLDPAALIEMPANNRLLIFTRR